MPKANKQQRHNARREAKRREARRREAVSPLKRLANSPGEIECWMSKDFEALGQCQIYVQKSAGGLSGIACFLVDRGVVGLKDAWVRMDISRLEFKEMLDKSASRNISMNRVTLDAARGRIAGGIRWAYENGMRLPKDWTRTVSLLGGVGDWMTADISPFAREFAGHPDDLRQRLIAEPFATYVRRTDIRFVFSDAAPYLDQQTGKYVDDEEPDEDDANDLASIAADLPMRIVKAMAKRLTPSATMLAEQTAAWLAAGNQTPSPELIEAWRILAVSSLISKIALPNATNKESADFGYDLVQHLSCQIEKL